QLSKRFLLVLSVHAFTSVERSLPVVVPLIDRIAARSSVSLKSVIPGQIRAAGLCPGHHSSRLMRKSQNLPLHVAAEAPGSPQCPRSSWSRLAWTAGFAQMRLFFSGHISAAASTMHSLTNSPSENGLLFLAILWDFTKLVLVAASLDVTSKQRRKADRIVLECQEQAYWLINRPPPGVQSVLDMGLERPSNQNLRVPLNSDFYKREIEASRRALGRNRVKSSICLEGFVKYCEQYQDHDPIMLGCLPSNPWISDDSAYWTINTEIVLVPTRLRVERWSFSFMELLSDPMGRKEFMTYLEKEFSAENLYFWQACEEIRHGESSKIPQKVEDVYKNFLAPGASRWVNIDSKTMDKTLEGIKRPHRFVLDDAQMHIYFLMKKDSYPRFLKSDLYKNMLSRAMVPQESKKSVFPFMRRQRHSSPSPAQVVAHGTEEDERTGGVGQAGTNSTTGAR
ncbi:regulator of G-protein signaling 11, partial [Nothobranchius furzeri]